MEGIILTYYIYIDPCTNTSAYYPLPVKHWSFIATVYDPSLSNLKIYSGNYNTAPNHIYNGNQSLSLVLNGMPYL